MGTALGIVNVTLTPTFSGSTYVYTGAVDKGETAGALTWTTAASTTATATLNGEDITSGDTITLTEGTNTIVVTVARTGYKDTVYTITIPVES